MEKRVLTAPLAIIKFNGSPILKAQNVSITENINRQPIQGIGNIRTQELPVTKWMGTINCSLYLTSIDTPEIDAIRRRVASSSEFDDQLLLNDQNGYTFFLFRRVEDAVDPATGKIGSTLNAYATIARAYPNTQSLSINEGQVGTTQQAFEYLDPIIYPS